MNILSPKQTLDMLGTKDEFESNFSEVSNCCQASVNQSNGEEGFCSECGEHCGVELEDLLGDKLKQEIQENLADDLDEDYDENNGD